MYYIKHAGESPLSNQRPWVQSLATSSFYLVQLNEISHCLYMCCYLWFCLVTKFCGRGALSSRVVSEVIRTPVEKEIQPSTRMLPHDDIM